MSIDNEELLSTVRRLADKEAIRDLVRMYAHCVWQDDIETAIDLFTEDGIMDPEIRPPIQGREALIASFKDMLAAGDFQPFVHNHVIELDGDRGTGTAYIDLRYTQEGKSMIGSGFYTDEYVRVDGHWKFKSRRLTTRFLVPLKEGWAEAQASDTP